MEIKCMDCGCEIGADGKCMCGDGNLCMSHTQFDPNRDVRSSLERIAVALEHVANALMAMDRRQERGRYK